MECISYLSPRRTRYHQIFRHLAHHLGKICITHIKKYYKKDQVTVRDRSQNRPRDYSAGCAK